MRDLIEDIVSLIMKGICPICDNKDLDDWCDGCQKYNGIKMSEVIENNWTKEDVLKVIEDRKRS